MVSVPCFNHGFTTPLTFLVNGTGNALLLRPNRSSNRYQFFRGKALQLSYQNWTFLQSVAQQKVTGRWEEGSFVPNTYPLFTTDLQMSRKNAVMQQTLSHVVKYQQNNWGIHFLNFRRSINNQFQGNHFSTYLNVNFDAHDVDVEIARDPQNNFAVQLHWNYLNRLNHHFQLLLNYFEGDYHSPYASSFSALSGVKNEHTGVFMWSNDLYNWKMNWVSMYAKFPQPHLNFRGDVYRKESYWEMDRYFGDQKVYLRLRGVERKQKFTTDANWQEYQVLKNYQLRVNYTLQINNKWEYQSRWENVYLPQASTEFSWLNYHQLAFQNKAFQIKCRYAIFDVQSHNSRVYVYRPNVTYAMGMKFYNRPGHSLALAVKYTWKQWKLEIALHHQHYSNLQEQGSGRNRLAGGSQTQADFQLVYKLFKYN